MKTGRTFHLPGGPIKLQYKVTLWSLHSDPSTDLVATPPGVFCPAHERKLLPKLASQFSLTMETVIQVFRPLRLPKNTILVKINLMNS